jgi:hypothetical protein
MDGRSHFAKLIIRPGSAERAITTQVWIPCISLTVYVCCEEVLESARQESRVWEIERAAKGSSPPLPNEYWQSKSATRILAWGASMKGYLTSWLYLFGEFSVNEWLAFLLGGFGG